MQMNKFPANSKLSHQNERPSSNVKNFEMLNNSIKSQLTNLQSTSQEVLSLLKSGKISNLVGLIKYF